MSLIINQQPSSDFIYPAWNKVQYLINSTNTTQSGFKVVCKVYRDPSGTNELVQVLNLEAIPGTTKVHISVQDIIQSYIDDNYSILNGGSTNLQSQDLLSFRLTFQEYYSGGLQGSVSTSGTVFVSRSAFSRVQWIQGDFSNWQIASDAVDNSFEKFLNGFENETETSGLLPVVDSSLNYLKMVFGQKQQLRFFRDNKAPALTDIELQVRYYREDFTVSNFNFITGITLEKGKLYSFDIGSAEIGAHTWNSQDDMTPRAGIDKYVAITLRRNGTSKTASVTKLFEWVPEVCSGFSPYEVHFLNRYGGFDSYTFTAKSRINTIVNQSTFKNEAVEIAGTSVVEKTSKRFVQPFHTQLSDTYTLNSQNLREWEYQGLRDLLTSPEVYLRIDGHFYSVVVVDNGQIRNHRTEEDDIFNMTIKLKLDNSELRQW